MVGVKSDNTLVTSNVGSWEIKNLPNSTEKAILINIDKKYNQHSDTPLFATKDGVVWRGWRDTAGEQEPMTMYNQKAFDAFTAKIVEGTGNSDTPKSQTEATKALLAGKTFYSVHVDEKILIKIEFNTDATAFTETNVNTQENETHPIRIEGNRWYGVDNSDQSYTIVSQTNGYIYFDDRYKDGSKDGVGHRLYTSQSDAQAYFNSIK
jgi:hypothetical protein